MCGKRQSQNYNVNEIAKKHAGGNRLDSKMAVAEHNDNDGHGVAHQLSGRGNEVTVLGV